MAQGWSCFHTAVQGAWRRGWTGRTRRRLPLLARRALSGLHGAEDGQAGVVRRLA